MLTSRGKGNGCGVHTEHYSNVQHRRDRRGRCGRFALLPGALRLIQLSVFVGVVVANAPVFIYTVYVNAKQNSVIEFRSVS